MAEYSTRQNKIKMAVGFLLIGLSLLLFILSVIPNFAVANFFMGIFGVMWFAYLIIAMLFGIANVMNLKFSYTKKFTWTLCLSLFFLIAILHTIFTNTALYESNRFADYANYLSGCYHLTNGATVGGAVVGAFVYFIKAAVGMVGLYCILVILLAIFAGLVLDSIVSKKARKRKKKQLPPRPKNQFIIPENEKVEHESTTEDPINSSTFYADILKDEEEKQPIYNQSRQTLFDDEEQPYTSITKQTDTRSARDILFGDNNVPDVTMPNDRERDMWMRNYREENGINREEKEVEEDSNISSLFGGNETRRVSDTYRRNFPERNVSIDDENDEEDAEIKPISSTSRFDERRGLSRSSTERISSESLDKPIKLGDNVEDVAKSPKIDFSQVLKPETPAKPEKPQGKQIGMSPIRYNGIPLSVFKVYKEVNKDYSEEYKRKSAALEKVMNEFDIAAKVINVVRGPKVTRYEMSLPAGVPTTKVTSIASNISMALESRSQIRIEAPIPGKNAIGIELENDTPSTVGMRELLESPEFVNCKDPLPIAIGKDINGKVIIKSLPKMIHLLVAGSSGSGKSIFIHSVMMSILYKYSPDDVRFVMVDPKRVEFTMYNNLPHLMFPDVLYEHDKALNALKWAVDEMMKRYDLLRNTECQNLEQYNKIHEVTSGQLPKMPYLIVVVDELAELMSGPLKKDFENAIQRITQLGRAAGMHMVVATQRPSVDVVTGTIKNNFSTRVAFSLASSADSRTVLDEVGAESLLGKGDMLFAPQDSNTKIRLQAAFCDNDEIRNAIRYVKENNQATYDDDVVKLVYAKKEESGGSDGDASIDGGGEVMDEFMKLAVKYAKEKGVVSVSQLQRKFRIGFNRAARIVDQMEEMGLVGPSIGSKPREFHISQEQYEELFGPDDDTEF